MNADDRRRHSDTTRRLAVVSLLAVAVLWVLPAPGYWIFTMNIGLILATTTLGLLILVGWVREVSLAHAGLTGTAAYVCAFALRSGGGLKWPFLLAAGLAIAVAMTLSVLIALAASRLSGIYCIVLTLALQVTIQKTIFTKVWLVHTDAQHTIPRPSLFGVGLDGDRAYYYFTLVLLAGLLLFLARLRRSRFGRGLVLVGTDRQVASAVGVSPWRAKIVAFALAGFCAGLAGALTAPLYSTPPNVIAYGWFVSLFYLSVPVLAGFESLMAVVVVALGFLVVPQALEGYNVSPFGLGAAGLLTGTIMGARGVSGMVLDRLRALRRCREATGSVLDVRTVVELAAGTSPDHEQRYDRALAVLEAYLPSRVETGDVLAAHHVSVTFGGVRALQEVSITVPAGRLVGLIGPNGAGKTTLFDVLNGLRTPDAGTISLFGEDITRRRPWDRAGRGVSRTFQASRLNLDLSVAENLMAGAYPMITGNLVESVVQLPRVSQSTRRAEEAAWAVAELFGIERYWDERAGMMSFGNRRRVEIGRSLMSGPRVLLLDEPSAGLDPTAARALFGAIGRLHRELGLPVLLVEHHVRVVLETCDLVYVLSRGEVVATGPPSEVVHDPHVRAEYLGPEFELPPVGLARGDG